MDFLHLFGFNASTNRGRTIHSRTNVPTKFDRIFKAQPIIYANKNDVKELDIGNKIMMPPSALDQLSQMNIQYPMMFKITNCKNQIHSHCSVLEFTAPEGISYLPLMMIHNLNLDPHDHGFIKIENVCLEKCTFAKFQPFSFEYVKEVPNQRVVLENQLRQYACLTEGDIINIMFGSKCFKIEVVELKPYEAVSIIETDINVEFETPKDIAKHQKSGLEQNLETLLIGGSHGSHLLKDSTDDEDDFGNVKPKNIIQSFSKIKDSIGYRLKDRKTVTKVKKDYKDQTVLEEENIGHFRYVYRVNKKTDKRELFQKLPQKAKNFFTGKENFLK